MKEREKPIHQHQQISIHAEMMKSIFLALLMAFFSVQSHAAPSALTPEQWRADLRQVDELIRGNHPRPFLYVDEDEYTLAIEELAQNIDQLSDKEIVMGMARVVAMIRDGHTRLAIPRADENIGLKISHSDDPAPRVAGLLFSQLPIQFEIFDDGVFVTTTTEAFREYVGWRLIQMGSLSVADATVQMKKISYAENPYFEQLMVADRLALPNALFAMGVVQDTNEVRVSLENAEGDVVSLSLAPIENAGAAWVGPFNADNVPLHTEKRQSNLWWEYVPSLRILYARIDQIGDDEIRFAEFAANIVAEAEHQDAKLVIDLRHNFGGSADFNRALVLAILQSRELNQFGRTFVLTGHRTFSAAQMLCNELETYSRVLFVGEPTGARPDHFSDSKKSQLDNSGLTLRVSTLHWSSSFANDQRDALYPDLPAPWTSHAYFNGDDTAIAAAGAFDGNIETLLRGAFQRGDQYQIARYLLSARLFPDTADQDITDMLLKMSNDFVAAGNASSATLLLRYGLFLHPDNLRLQSALDTISAEKE